MDSRPRRRIPTGAILAGLLACGMLTLAIAPPARAQSRPEPDPARRDPPQPAVAAKPAAQAARPRPVARAPRREPNEAFQAEIRKTVEQRRRRRARRGQGQVRGAGDPRPVGAIVPWPMPPALIIRQTPQVHDEVGSLLDGLRRGG
jgi:hypothetical protein